MTRKVTLFIADSNRDFLYLCGQIFTDRDLIVTLSPEDVGDIPEAIREANPDVVLTGLWLQGSDALNLIAAVRKIHMKNPPKWIIMYSGEDSNELKRRLPKDVSYIIEKPFDADLLADRIRRLADYREYAGSRIPKGGKKIADLLRQLGVPPHVSGYTYLIEAITMACENRDLLQSVTGRLYPEIARRHSTTPASVEKAIRHAVRLAWDRCDPEFLHKWFGYRGTDDKKPTSSEFIAIISDWIRMDSILGKEAD